MREANIYTNNVDEMLERTITQNYTARLVNDMRNISNNMQDLKKKTGSVFILPSCN